MYKYICLLIMASVIAACSSSTPSSANGGTDPNAPNITDKMSEVITIRDGTDSRRLTFGMQDKATDSLDQGLDTESPPFAPPGAFSAYFVIQGHRLFKDIKTNKSRRIHWSIELSKRGNRDIKLSWNIEASSLEGTVTLQDRLKDPKVKINMLSQNRYSVPADSALGKLFILYKNDT